MEISMETLDIAGRYRSEIVKGTKLIIRPIVEWNRHEVTSRWGH